MIARTEIRRLGAVMYGLVGAPEKDLGPADDRVSGRSVAIERERRRGLGDSARRDR
jgi:hypothetical protein